MDNIRIGIDNRVPYGGLLKRSIKLSGKDNFIHCDVKKCKLIYQNIYLHFHLYNVDIIIVKNLESFEFVNLYGVILNIRIDDLHKLISDHKYNNILAHCLMYRKKYPSSYDGILITIPFIVFVILLCYYICFFFFFILSHKISFLHRTYMVLSFPVFYILSKK